MVPTAREERFERLFAGSYEPLLAYAARRCATGEDAADVVAETFSTAWRRLEDVPDGDHGRFWLYATARRVLANQRRGTRRRSALHERLVREADRVVDAATAADECTTGVAAALRRLSDADRELLQLTAWEGLTPTQLAAVLGCSPAAARVRLHRARTRLRAQLPPATTRAAGGTAAGAQPTGGRP